MEPESRIEHDSLGAVSVPSDRFWGAQTQRALGNFPIGDQQFRPELIWALALIKKAAAHANKSLGVLDAQLAEAIEAAAEDVLSGQLADHFPLPVWQTGSGTQTHMNVNEVIANRANARLAAQSGKRRVVHPNDHVNLSQSSNDVFPSAMHIAAARAIHDELIPAVETLRAGLSQKADTFSDIIKIGRTHLQDATPLTLGQEFSGYVAQLDSALEALRNALPPLYALALGGTAVGTGLNTPQGFDAVAISAIAKATALPFVPAANKFAALAGHEALVIASGACKTLAVAALKIANDIRWMGSGPRCGLGELSLPANEPGSSIMPGKINPTQAEALSMVCVQVMGNDAAIGIAASQGNFELNVYKPLIIHNLLESIRLLADACQSFNSRCVQGLDANREHIGALLERSLMLVTALAPHIGYDKAAKIAQRAHQDGCSLREAALACGDIAADDLDRWLRPESMLGPTPT